MYLLEPIYLSLNCGVILISKTERGGFPVITEGLDVPSRASTQVVSSETQQPSKNSTLTSVSGQSNSLMSNMLEWEKIGRWKRTYLQKCPEINMFVQGLRWFSLFWQVYPFRSISSTQASEIWRRYSSWSIVDIMILRPYRFCLSCGNRQFLNNAELFLINTHDHNILMLW